mgnify:CR=1 FL=1
MNVLTEVVNGISTALYKATGCPVFTEEGKNNITFPCFYVSLLNDEREQHLDKRYMSEHDFDIRLFFNDADEVTDVDTAAEIAEVLYDVLEYITVSTGQKLRGTKMSNRITDGVLHFFVSYDFFILKPREPGTKMQTLDFNEGVKTNGE